jgi:hypothetical protein
MKTQSSTPWLRLAAAARRAPASVVSLDGAPDGDTAAPYGFSARVVARAQLGSAPTFGAVFERLAARALGVACACALTMVVWGTLSTSAEAKSSDIGADLYDPIGEAIPSTQS